MSQNTVRHTAVIQGKRIDVAPLETIDYARLEASEPAEIAKLLKACHMPGFFYLDVQGAATREVLVDLQSVLGITEKYFEQPLEVKMKEYRESVERGYKPGDCESFEIAREEMVGKSLVPPSILIEHAGLLERFLSLSHRITYTMLSRLSDALNLVGDHRFENSHREGEPTDTALKLIYEPTQACLADVVENKHTDFGTLTLLFGEQWGLHVELPETNTWGFVEPRAGYAVVNVADSLEHLSGKKLHSGVHRITQLVDVLQERYYIVYLLRPESGIKLRDAKEN